MRDKVEKVEVPEENLKLLPKFKLIDNGDHFSLEICDGEEVSE
jgi:hypothetical protein